MSFPAYSRALEADTTRHQLYLYKNADLQLAKIIDARYTMIPFISYQRINTNMVNPAGN